MSRPEDIHVGQRLRQRRLTLGLSQQDVADACGIRFQQIQKYETGANRVSASRLCDLAGILHVAPSYFFEGLTTDAPESELRGPDELRLLRAFRKSSAAARDAMLRIADATATTTTA